MLGVPFKYTFGYEVLFCPFTVVIKNGLFGVFALI